MPETTGMALQALAGLVPKAAVERSMDYLKSEIEHLNAPMSFAWGTLGLGAWGETVERREDRILEILGRQESYGPYDTVSLSLLLLAFRENIHNTINGLCCRIGMKGCKHQVSGFCNG